MPGESTPTPDEAVFEGPENEAGVHEPEAGDITLQWRFFAGIGAFFAAAAVLYWLTSYENAGSTMLALAAGLAFFAGAYLFVQDRKLARAGDDSSATEASGSHDQPGHFAPHASIWPFGIGVGAYLVTNGLILGIWFLLPGLVVLAASAAGYSLQSRRRD